MTGLEVVGAGTLAVGGLAVAWAGICVAIDFVNDVRNYPRAKDLADAKASIERTCAELLDERDALRRENALLRSVTPYRGPMPNEGGEK